ncbi:hypothetical protein BD410DRAFT_599026 [Rickenella mellea]|uniref:Uncharacterized protein n=1 Tax=Rickenella mellea TaxID=50990 RepID=A0A4Y7QDU7_9AGAM|nr:hypothetical protein BD410DRAFT_599026 [Rickenella mellea]
MRSKRFGSEPWAKRSRSHVEQGTTNTNRALHLPHDIRPSSFKLQSHWRPTRSCSTFPMITPIVFGTHALHASLLRASSETILSTACINKRTH